MYVEIIPIEKVNENRPIETEHLKTTRVALT